jgi:hypothetical protein
LNTSSAYRFKDLKSSNLSMLTSERNPRLIENLNPSKSNYNYNTEENNLNNIINNALNKQVSFDQNDFYQNSDLN